MKVGSYCLWSWVGRAKPHRSPFFKDFRTCTEEGFSLLGSSLLARERETGTVDRSINKKGNLRDKQPVRWLCVQPEPFWGAQLAPAQGRQCLLRQLPEAPTREKKSSSGTSDLLKSAGLDVGAPGRLAERLLRRRLPSSASTGISLAAQGAGDADGSWKPRPEKHGALPGSGPWPL